MAASQGDSRQSQISQPFESCRNPASQYRSQSTGAQLPPSVCAFSGAHAQSEQPFSSTAKPFAQARSQVRAGQSSPPSALPPSSWSPLPTSPSALASLTAPGAPASTAALAPPSEDIGPSPASLAAPPPPTPASRGAPPSGACPPSGGWPPVGALPPSRWPASPLPASEVLGVSVRFGAHAMSDQPTHNRLAQRIHGRPSKARATRVGCVLHVRSGCMGIPDGRGESDCRRSFSLQTRRLVHCTTF